ncbi:MAG: CRISPR-associated helicase Cas3' [Phycisphaerales bacterium]|nr:CRISPR-associated helicase Cas3' [Phycisphaerales bacterium]
MDATKAAGVSQPFYAHSLPERPRDEWEPLQDHARRVADGFEGCPGARGFAAVFGAQDMARLLGLWHDLGKYSGAFQNYISSGENGLPGDPHRAEMKGRVDHSTAGAQHAASRGQLGGLLAYCIAGHHGGLPDYECEGRSGLRHRLTVKGVEPWRHAAPAADLELQIPPPRLPGGYSPFALSFLTRMLFSCLVDADFLATEWFMNRSTSDARPRAGATVAELRAQIDKHLLGFITPNPAPVSACRARVLEACREKAALSPGFFSLEVPTGGGKTLSSLAFALAHAEQHDLRRVVYAIPYTSIIEQTATVFRQALDGLSGELLEHHSSLDPADPEKVTEQSRLAAENFDSTLIVTTNVQLFESLFASRTSRCRKLHRLARSVIILDEAQTLPPELLHPTLAALTQLVDNYGCTVVLCTATQPALKRRLPEFPIGIEPVTPIIDDPKSLHVDLRRTRIEVTGRLSDDELAARILAEPRCLCIVNSTGHARDLFRLVQAGDPHAVHLSARMCPAHRSDVLEAVRIRLKGDGPCRVVSTQVVEAGVDIDFPVVFRAAAGLDSIAQAAGRCNREGKLPVGRVYVFEYDEKQHRPPDEVRQAACHFREIQPAYPDLLHPEAVNHYFRLHYWRRGGEGGTGWDRGAVCEETKSRSVMGCFREAEGKGPPFFQFRQAAEIYRMIPDAQTPVLVPYTDRGRKLRAELVAIPESTPDITRRLRDYDRAAQRYSVGVYDRELQALSDNAVLIECHGRFALGRDEDYDPHLGLRGSGSGLDPDSLMP